MAHAFGSCTEAHPNSCPDVVSLVQVEKVAEEHIMRIADTSEQARLKEELKEVMTSSVLYASHLLRTKHQGNYHKFVLKNLQPGEVVVIIDYKMKLKLGVRLREIQRDWYGKRGISLHGLLAIAQVEENKKVSEVLDLWSEDTKQDSWFSQSAWMWGLNGCSRHSLDSEYIYFLVSSVVTCIVWFKKIPIPTQWKVSELSEV